MVYKQNGQRSRRLKNAVGRIGAAVLLTYTLPLDKACLREACGTGHPTTHLKIPVVPRCKASKRGLPDKSACSYPYSRPVCMTFDGGLPHDVLTSDRLSSKPTTLLRNAWFAWLFGGHNGCSRRDGAYAPSYARPIIKQHYSAGRAKRQCSAQRSLRSLPVRNIKGPSSPGVVTQQ